MERSSGLKECPRCGLRNRQGTCQCDFCGWDFRAATDDWIGQVNDLENIGRGIEPVTMDTTTRSKIEMTMKKPSEMPVAEKKPDKRLEVPPHLSLEDRGDVLAQATEVMMAETEAETFTPVEESTVDLDQPMAVEEHEVLSPPAEVVEASPAPAAHGITLQSVTRMPQFVPAGLLSMGLAVYVLDIYVVSMGILNGALAWGVSIIASLLMAYAVIRYLPMLMRGKKGKEDEAILCPVCHELVSDEEAKCPSCGVKFKDAPSRE
ncbi:MAG: hypothetical protein ISF22_07445 [Methanomassiliicoccus sp.]|nr:hypothetical protein [Methanomassiliicoccus sp.]